MLKPRAHVLDGAPSYAQDLATAMQALKPVIRLHSIPPSKAVMLGGSASSRKSRASDLCNDFITKSAYAPVELKDQRAYMAEATLRGLRNCILQTHRAAFTTDEIMNALSTPWSDCQSVAHFIPKSKLCTYTQGERDDVVTANGPVHLRHYAFQLRLFGQVEAMEWVLRPGPQGFFKRIAFALSPDRNRFDDALVTSTSMGLWQALRDFMLAGPYRKAVYIHCDGQARGLFRAILRGISDWLESKQAVRQPVCRWFAVKVGFAFSDILRSASVVKRHVQFLGNHTAVPMDDVNRTTIQAMEMMAAVHKYFRELELHAGYYRFMKNHENPCAGDDRRANQHLAESLERAPPPPEPATALGEEKQFQRDIIETGKTCGNSFTTSDIRVKLRNKYKYRNLENLAEQLHEHVHKLAQVGLLKAANGGNPEREKQHKGPRRQMQLYQLSSWQAIESRQEAADLCQSLQLSRDAFE